MQRIRSVCFVGGGRITRAIISGLRLRRGSRDARSLEMEITVCDRHARKLLDFRRNLGVRTTESLVEALGSDLMVLAVRPQSVNQVLKILRQEPPRKIAALSLCAGISLQQLKSRLGTPVRWARAMPSPAGSSGNGFTALCYGANFPANAKNAIYEMFSAIGEVANMTEREMDAFTVTFSPTHGQHALAALAKAGEKLGLSRELAQLAAAHALADSISHWRARGAPPLAELLAEAQTPGGIAAETIRALDRGGYSKSIERALRAGMKRLKKNAAI